MKMHFRSLLQGAAVASNSNRTSIRLRQPRNFPAPPSSFRVALPRCSTPLKFTAVRCPASACSTAFPAGLYPSHAQISSKWQQFHFAAQCKASGNQRTGNHRSKSLHRKRPVNRQPQIARRIFLLYLRRRLRSAAFNSQALRHFSR